MNDGNPNPAGGDDKPKSPAAVKAAGAKPTPKVKPTPAAKPAETPAAPAKETPAKPTAETPAAPADALDETFKLFGWA